MRSFTIHCKPSQWWLSKTPEQQHQYLLQHPNSKLEVVQQDPKDGKYHGALDFVQQKTVRTKLTDAQKQKLSEIAGHAAERHLNRLKDEEVKEMADDLEFLVNTPMPKITDVTKKALRIMSGAVQLGLAATFAGTPFSNDELVTAGQQGLYYLTGLDLWDKGWRQADEDKYQERLEEHRKKLGLHLEPEDYKDPARFRQAMVNAITETATNLDPRILRRVQRGFDPTRGHP